MTWGTITDEGVAAAEELINVPLRRDRMQWIEEITVDSIRHFAWGIGDNNPLWLDRKYASQSVYGDLVAPPCILYAVDGTVVAPKLPGVQWLYAGTSWTWFEPILLGDKFNVEARLKKQELKSGRRFSKWILQTGEINYFNQKGRMTGKAIARCARTPRGEALKKEKRSKPFKSTAPHSYTQKEIEEIENQVIQEPRRGSEHLFWGDVSVGEMVPQVVRGPLGVIDIMAWYSGQQGATHYGGVHGDAIRYRRRHADYHLNKQTGAKESAGRGHLETSTGRDVGMGGAYDVGPQRIAWAQHMMTNWIGDNGFLHTLNINVRKPNLVGDTIWWTGTVVEKDIVKGYGLIKVDLKAVNQNGLLSADGDASVVLPFNKNQGVCFPLPELIDAS